MKISSKILNFITVGSIAFLIFFFVLLSSVNASSTYTNDLTSVDNGNCIESDHVGTNDCNRLFLGYNGSQNMWYNNYWQTGTGSHWVGFDFYSSQKISKYTMFVAHGDSDFYPTAWHLTADVNGVETTIDTQTGFSFVVGVLYNFEISLPVSSSVYKLYIDSTGVNGVLLTQMQMMSSGDDFLNIPLSIGSGSYLSSITFTPTTLGDILFDIREYILFTLVVICSALFYYLYRDFVPWRSNT